MLLQSVVYAQTPSADTSDAPPRLKLAPILVPPPPKALKPGAGSDRDAVYLRADLLEGESEKSIQASGKVELRTRRQTVLADWLHYDLVTEEVWAKGDVLMRQGVDWISGPEAKFKRGDETGFFHQPEFHIGDNASRGDATDLLFVGENRYEAGRVAIEQHGATALVLDDGFQHRTLAKDLEILVVQGRAPWGNARVFPRGMLREPLSALRRAHLVLVTNPPDAAQVAAVTETVRRYNSRAPVLTARYSLEDALETQSGRRVPVGELAGRRLLAFAGLGSPLGFADTLDSIGIRRVGFVELPDHHWFTARDVQELTRDGRASGAQGLVTTEKDWVRIRDLAPSTLPLWVLPVRLALESGRDLWQQALAAALATHPLGRSVS